MLGVEPRKFHAKMWEILDAFCRISIRDERNDLLGNGSENANLFAENCNPLRVEKLNLTESHDAQWK